MASAQYRLQLVPIQPTDFFSLMVKYSTHEVQFVDAKKSIKIRGWFKAPHLYCKGNVLVSYKKVAGELVKCYTLDMHGSGLNKLYANDMVSAVVSVVRTAAQKGGFKLVKSGWTPGDRNVAVVAGGNEIKVIVDEMGKTDE